MLSDDIYHALRDGAQTRYILASPSPGTVVGGANRATSLSLHLLCICDLAFQRNNNKMGPTEKVTARRCTLCGRSFQPERGCACSLFPPPFAPRLEHQWPTRDDQSHQHGDKRRATRKHESIQDDKAHQSNTNAFDVVWWRPCATEGRLDCDLSGMMSCNHCIEIATSSGGDLKSCRQSKWPSFQELLPFLQKLIVKYGGVAPAKAAVTPVVPPMQLRDRPLFKWCYACAVRGNMDCDTTEEGYCTECIDAIEDDEDLQRHCGEGEGLWPVCSMARAQLENRIIQDRASGKLEPPPARGSAESFRATFLYGEHEQKQKRRDDWARTQGMYRKPVHPERLECILAADGSSSSSENDPPPADHSPAVTDDESEDDSEPQNYAELHWKDRIGWISKEAEIKLLRDDLFEKLDDERDASSQLKLADERADAWDNHLDYIHSEQKLMKHRYAELRRDLREANPQTLEVAVQPVPSDAVDLHQPGTKRRRSSSSEDTGLGHKVRCVSHDTKGTRIVGGEQDHDDPENSDGMEVEAD